MKLKVNSLNQQRINAELEGIIEEFGQAMRNANKSYIAHYVASCSHEKQIPFTLHMEQIWDDYRGWCRQHGKKA
jgi:hypothetical protein